MIAIDTNLLVYAHRSEAPEHAAARAAIERASRHPAGWALPAPAVIEFWSVVTRASVTWRPSTVGEARSFIEALAEAGARLLSSGPGVAPRIMDAAEQLSVVGARVFDLHIAMTALDHGATELWSHDRRFVTLPGLRLVDPLAS